MSRARRYQVENQARWLGWCVRERGQRRIAVFVRRSEAREYARWRNSTAPQFKGSDKRDGQDTGF